MASKTRWVLGLLALLMPFQAVSQTANDMAGLMGLAPVTVLSKNERRQCGARGELHRDKWYPKRHDPPGDASTFRGTAATGAA